MSGEDGYGGLSGKILALQVWEFLCDCFFNLKEIWVQSLVNVLFSVVDPLRTLPGVIIFFGHWRVRE